MTNHSLCTLSSCWNHGGYSRRCGHLNFRVKEEKPANPRSKKLDKLMKKQYVPEVKKMVEAGTACAINSPVCTGRAQGFHHLAGRIGEQLMKDKVPCCNACNRAIEQNDAWARQNGYKRSKFSVKAKNQKIGEA